MASFQHTKHRIGRQIPIKANKDVYRKEEGSGGKMYQKLL
jgi:hypothetical protein